MKRLLALLVVGAMALMLAPPAHAQAPAAPAAKVTIRGLVDNMASFVRNYSQNDLNATKTDRETLGHTRSRPDIIAEVGTSGRTTGPNLHFEVRYDNHAYNPLSYLAPPGPSPIESFARNGPS